MASACAARAAAAVGGFQAECRLAIARRKRIGGSPTTDPLGGSLCDTSENHADIAVPDQRDIVQFVLDEQRNGPLPAPATVVRTVD